ncbi:hypothetical protein GCM10023107_02110 [Actinoplanes octamycinicus]|uniref:hypothetical protein n=1 Tax=Actinoplanes octamycinicus TaxID=135948 RepID=UPI0031E77DB7
MASITRAAGDEIVVTGVAQREAWRARVLPPVERLAGGIWSVPVPIPHNPLRYTLSYLIPGDDGLVVVDPGWASDEGWAALQAGLVAAGASRRTCSAWWSPTCTPTTTVCRKGCRTRAPGSPCTRTSATR